MHFMEHERMHISGYERRTFLCRRNAHQRSNFTTPRGFYVIRNTSCLGAPDIMLKAILFGTFRVPRKLSQHFRRGDMHHKGAGKRPEMLASLIISGGLPFCLSRSFHTNFNSTRQDHFLCTRNYQDRHEKGPISTPLKRRLKSGRNETFPLPVPKHFRSPEIHGCLQCLVLGLSIVQSPLCLN